MKFFNNITIIEYGPHGGKYYVVTDYEKSLFGANPTFSSFLKRMNSDDYHCDSYEEAVHVATSYIEHLKEIEENRRKRNQAALSILSKDAKIKQIFKL
jgi:hypothetical protein